jgi:hypothetical protein
MILEAEIEYENHRLIIFNNHWKSKRGGGRESEPARLASSVMIVERIREIQEEGHKVVGQPSDENGERSPRGGESAASDIVVLGDLNENIEEYHERGKEYPTALMPYDGGAEAGERADESLWLTAAAGKAGWDGQRLVMYEPWYEKERGERGSYVYRRTWQTPDHILLGAGLFDGRGIIYEEGGFRVLRSSFLVDENTGFPKFRRGAGRLYSDHLPLLVTLKVAPEKEN